MHTSFKPQQLSVAHRWFCFALGLSGIFLIYTIINATGVLDVSTLSVEHWLLKRPIGRLDCVFYEWRHVGDIPASVLLVLLVGIICWRAGYSWKNIPVLLVLLMFCVSIEYLGKHVFTLVLTRNLYSGITVLTCPQMLQEPSSVRLETMAALWWHIPDPPAIQVSWASDVANMPLVVPVPASLAAQSQSYPSGHAMRWCLLGLVAAWLCWKHVWRRVGRMVLTIIALVASFFGGFMQFYIGAHFLTDTLAGYVLGAAAACCAIGFLCLLDGTGKHAGHRR